MLQHSASQHGTAQHNQPESLLRVNATHAALISLSLSMCLRVSVTVPVYPIRLSISNRLEVQGRAGVTFRA
jgi:hypothetical protein